MIHSLPKPEKAIRLTGDKKKALQQAVLERDSFHCVACGEWTDQPPHHIEYVGQGGQDVADNMCALCFVCHDIIHHGDMNDFIDRAIQYHGARRIVKVIIKGVIEI